MPAGSADELHTHLPGAPRLPLVRDLSARLPVLAVPVHRDRHLRGPRRRPDRGHVLPRAPPGRVTRPGCHPLPASPTEVRITSPEPSRRAVPVRLIPPVPPAFPRRSPCPGGLAASAFRRRSRCAGGGCVTGVRLVTY